MANESDGKLALFASGLSGPYGKYTEEVKTLLDEHTHIEWLRLCASKDKKSSEFLREILYIVIHGQAPGEISSQDIRDVLAQKGRNDAIQLHVRGEVKAS